MPNNSNVDYNILLCTLYYFSLITVHRRARFRFIKIVEAPQSHLGRLSIILTDTLLSWQWLFLFSPRSYDALITFIMNKLRDNMYTKC